MKKGLNASTISVILLSVAFIIMSVGFASYTQNLNINGNVTAKKAEWKVQFNDSTYLESKDSVKASAKTLTATSFSYDVTLNPGEFYESTVNVENTGTIAATLKGITLSQLTEAQSKFIKYTVYYDSASYTATTTGLNKDLAVNTNQNVKVRVEYIYPEDANDVPTEDVKISLTGVLNYVQKETLN